MKTFLDRYSMMIVSKYFVCLNDFKNLILVCKKFEEIPLMFHFNPISWKPKIKIYFENVETLHLYSKHDKFVSGFYQYYVHYPLNLTKLKMLNEKMKVVCPHIAFSARDLQNGFSYIYWSAGTAHFTTSRPSQSVDLELNASCLSVFSNIKKKLFITRNDVIKYVSIDCPVTEICESAFYGMKYIGDKNIAPTVKVIRKDALSGSDLKQLDLSHVEVFEKQENLKTLTALTMNSTITFNKLYQCDSLQSIEIVGAKLVKGKAACWMKTLFDAKNLEVDEYVYTCKDCELLNGMLPSNITNLKTVKNDVRLKDLEIDTYSVPDSVTAIFPVNFEKCKSIKKLLLPKCLNTCFDFSLLTTIQEAALLYTEEYGNIINWSGQLTSITFLNNDLLNNERILNLDYRIIKNIEFAQIQTDFIYRGNVDYQIYKLLKPKYKIEGDIVLYYLYNWKVYNGVYYIPDDVTVVSHYLENKYDSLKEIWVGENTRLIKENAFYDCKNLVLVKNLKRSTIIENFAFGKSHPRLEYKDIN
ncbi:hypothetical protein EIN_180170 [Entamoeba invadens IP1]|uniref:hypothetical protein n=1 Tax=Entamoeba invadens IP1 TaxID=370355 RepID=UPI0002C3FBB6|nr:hypothetical protein EIN_180170 [Entamoeba invadens IP1]ELP93950.1 hypothetical protein EIN_180170 [Entamoeba invadens IP1]|eukprot:XP_004260721.1 hypothetical protein EIN_180170 [Entamoeba invadens IP1]